MDRLLEEQNDRSLGSTFQSGDIHIKYITLFISSL